MTKGIRGVLWMAAALVLWSLPAWAAAPFHIGVVTGTVSQGEDVLRGAERLLALYGDAAKGGYIKHVTYPDNFMAEMETTMPLSVTRCRMAA